MTCSQNFMNEIHRYGIKGYYGVPDSTLGSLCDLIQQEDGHVVGVNEGASVAMGVGHYLATGNIPLIYMQNSGFGNALNPLLSLCDRDVYSIPMLLLVGWRGMPGGKDEPQHYKQGMVMEALLKAVNIPYCILNPDANEVSKTIKWAVEEARGKSCPVVMLAPPGVFKKNAPLKFESNEMGRRDAIEIIINSLDKESIIVASTGYIGRETHDVVKDNPDAPPVFLVVGSMGHASQIAFGLALSKKDKTVVCLDGDGAALMHMGGLASIGASRHSIRFIHIVLNNGVHASVGGMPTVAKKIQFSLIAKGCGYKNIITAKTKEELLCALTSDHEMGTSFLEVGITPDTSINAGRPENSLISYRDTFIEKVQKK